MRVRSCSRPSAGAPEKGCSSSKEKLVAFQKACGTECTTSVGKQIAKLEKSAAAGCEKSQKQLARLVALFGEKKAKAAKKATPVSLSDKCAQFVAGAEKGCASSKEKLVALKKACGTECSFLLPDEELIATPPGSQDQSGPYVGLMKNVILGFRILAFLGARAMRVPRPGATVATWSPRAG